MKNAQKIVLLTTGPDGPEGLDSVNDHLQHGWRVLQATPMGGRGTSDGPYFGALVVLERAARAEAGVLTQEAVDELIESTAVEETLLDEVIETSEGDGAPLDLPDAGVRPS